MVADIVVALKVPKLGVGISPSMADALRIRALGALLCNQLARYFPTWVSRYRDKLPWCHGFVTCFCRTL